MAAQAQSDETELLAGLRRGDNVVYRRAVRLYTPAMLAAARVYCDPDTAEDVVQESWLTVIDAIHGFEGRSSLKTWLCTITVNKARYSHRRRKRETTVDFQDPQHAALLDRFDGRGAWKVTVPWDFESADSILEMEALQDCIRKHMDRMSDNHRAVLLMRDMYQMDARDVCNILDVSETNIRVLLHRARQHIFSMVEQFRETGRC